MTRHIAGIFKKPSFLVTLDVEGDDQWARPKSITTDNAGYLPRFQALCEKHGFRPTYLVNYEMAISPVFQKFGRDSIKNNLGEIGCHIHAWNSLPSYQLTSDDLAYHPYLIEYPEDIIHQKISFQTKLLEETFCVKINSHRAGRWGFNEIYAQILCEHKYCVDCSVTPFVSWKQHMGDPSQHGGPDYVNFSDNAYFLDTSDIKKAGKSNLLEVPVTIIKSRPKIVGSHSSPVISWLRPNGNNLETLLHIIKVARKEKRDYVEFMMHSSELMPAGSPTFITNQDIEKLYKDMDTLFYEAGRFFKGRTLKEYYDIKLSTDPR